MEGDALMPWFKLDDGFYDHPKFADLSDEAVALWIRGAAYCSRHLTDGFLKAGMANRLGSLVGATELESAGLWDVVDGGWQFHDWLDYQPSRASAMASRATNKDRQRRFRESSRNAVSNASRNAATNGARNADTSAEGAEGAAEGVKGHRSEERRQTTSNALSEVETATGNAVSNASRNAVTNGARNSTPSRPVLYNSLTTFERENAPSKTGSKSPSKAARLPEGWTPDPKLVAEMRAELPGVDLEAEHRKFTDHWIAQPGRQGVKADWRATWRNWMRRAPQFQGRPRTGVDWGAAMDRAAERDRQEGLL